ncbi:hypothetical protein [Burkholderia ubonensis]|uniref:hypothetical protein n=1 Tax=Burkholderia ubonensis TaxID=101571 RepID=UPI0012F714C4|nr:hypothetical protein [Burkholderia ubonensis]
MHVTVSWDISAAGDKWNEINEKMKGALKGYSWVRPLKSVYVVNVDSAEDRLELKNNLIEVVKSSDERVNFIITPPMDGGSYSGWLPKSLWEKINQRTK